MGSAESAEESNVCVFQFSLTQRIGEDLDWPIFINSEDWEYLQHCKMKPNDFFYVITVG